MFSGTRCLFDDIDLLGGIDGNVNDLDLRSIQQFVDRGIDVRYCVVSGSALGLFAIAVRDAENFEAGLFVSGQMRVVDDPPGANDANATVHAPRQFGFVIEMRENVRFVKVFFHKLSRANGFCATQTLAVTAAVDKIIQPFLAWSCTKKSFSQ